MRLTQFTDYALRLLLQLASDHPGGKTTVGEASRLLGIPLNHLTKIALRLAKAGMVTAIRGRNGGLVLSRPASQITIGQVLRITEPDFALVGCMAGQDCSLFLNCKMIPLLGDALAAFLRVADQATIEEMLQRPVRTQA